MNEELDTIIQTTIYEFWSSRMNTNNPQRCQSLPQTSETETGQKARLNSVKQRRVFFCYLCFLLELAFCQSCCTKCLSVDSKQHFGLIELSYKI